MSSQESPQPGPVTRFFSASDRYWVSFVAWNSHMAAQPSSSWYESDLRQIEASSFHIKSGASRNSTILIVGESGMVLLVLLPKASDGALSFVRPLASSSQKLAGGFQPNSARLLLLIAEQKCAVYFRSSNNMAAVSFPLFISGFFFQIA